MIGEGYGHRRRSDRIGAGAIYGAYAWTIFVLAERTCASVLPALGLVFTAPSAPNLLIMWAYPVIGALVGAAVGAVLPQASVALQARRVRSLVMATLVVAFMGGATSASFSRTVQFSLALAVVLLVALAMQWPDAQGRLAKRVDVLSPWSLGPLLAVPYFTKFGGPLQSMGIKLVVPLATLVLLVAISVITARQSRARRLVAWRAAAAVLGVLLLASLYDGGVVGRRRAFNATAANQPDVVLIVLDTMRADHLPTYGYPLPTMPRLDIFARTATVFERASAASDMTLSSTASMFTGVYPFQHGAYTRRGQLVGSEMTHAIPTLAETLGARGYQTSGIVANSGFLHPVYGFGRGFESYQWDLFDSAYLLDRIWLVARFGNGALHYAAADRISDQALRAIDRVTAEEQPFFLFLNYMDAHWPLAPPAPYVERFGRALTPTQVSALTDHTLAGTRPLAEEERTPLSHHYDGSAAFLDDHLSRVMERLKATGRYDRMLVIVTSDHGELLGEGGHFGHGLGVQEEVIRVPLIAKFPGQFEGRRVNARANHVDIAPTVLEAVTGVALEQVGAGRSLSRLEDKRGGPVMAMSFPANSGGVEMAVYLDSAKVVVAPSGARRLYDLGSDPEANDDVSASQQALVQDLITRARELNPPTAVGLNPDLLDRLRSLGYVR
jgi:arylsulfatase A-like enzyme